MICAVTRASLTALLFEKTLRISITDAEALVSDLRLWLDVLGTTVFVQEPIKEEEVTSIDALHFYVQAQTKL